MQIRRTCRLFSASSRMEGDSETGKMAQEGKMLYGCVREEKKNIELQGQWREKDRV